MTASRWQAVLAAAAIAAAIAWGLWRSPASVEVPSKAESPGEARVQTSARGGAGFAGAALRDAVVQSGAPGSTPAVDHPATPADGFVEVRVLAQGKPRKDAHVRLYLRESGDWRFAGAADSAEGGVARISARPGRYLIAARWGTFAPARVELRRPAGEPITRAVVELQPGVFVAGRTVQKGTREAVPLALVTLIYEASNRPDAPAEEQARATSDALGRFRIDALEAGRYLATAQAAGYAKATSTIDASASKDVVLELSQASFIEGRVLASDGSPAAGAEVIATGGEQLSAVASETGSFSIEVSPRSWQLSARRADEAGAADRPVVVGPGATARGVQIRLGAASGISGTVVAAASRKPIGGAQIAISPRGATGDSGRAGSDASGAFTVRGLPPGSYDVDVSAPGFVSADRSGITVVAGQQFPLRIELRQTGAVAGVVRDAASRPVAFALVRAGENRVEARTDEGGNYRLDGIASGHGWFTALRDGSSLGSGESAEVPEGGVARLDFNLSDEGVVTGRVRRADGSPAPADAVVTAYSRGYDRVQIPVDARGVYLASLPAGPYSLVTGRSFQLHLVTVEAGKTATLDLVWSDAADDGRGFSGLVLEPDGTPSPEATVRGDGTFARSTDEQGRFHLDRSRADLPDNFELTAINGGRAARATVPPGQSEVTLQLQPAATVRGHLDSAAQSFRVELSLGQSLEFAGDRFELLEVSALPQRLTVTTDDGRWASQSISPSPGVTLEMELKLQAQAKVTGRLTDADTRAPIEGLVLLDRQPVFTGADGRFALETPPGEHTLRASADRYATLSKTFTAQAGQSFDLGDLALEKERAPSGGIGIQLRGDSEMKPTVVSVFEGSPADLAGIRVGDEIATVDGVPVKSVTDAIARIRGKPGTPLQLTVVRQGQPINLSLIRSS